MSKFEKSALKVIAKDKVDAIDLGTTGLHTNSKKDVEKAQKALVVCQEIESQRIKDGWIWLTSGKTSKLVHPDKAKQLLKEGWKKLKTKTIKPKQ
jgi:hypothetical protein